MPGNLDCAFLLHDGITTKSELIDKRARPAGACSRALTAAAVALPVGTRVANSKARHVGARDRAFTAAAVTDEGLRRQAARAKTQGRPAFTPGGDR